MYTCSIKKKNATGIQKTIILQKQSAGSLPEMRLCILGDADDKLTAFAPQLFA
jgi:hypothetical protein